MLDYSQSSKSLVSDREMQWKKETLGPLLQSNTRKWEINLAPWEIALTEKVCHEAFHRLGYRKEIVLAELVR